MNPIAKQSLLEAAKAVLTRYDADDGVIEGIHDSDVMDSLRQAVQEAEIIPEYNCSLCVPDNCACAILDKFVEYDPHKPELYKPMTDDERRALSNSVYECRFAGVEKIERAVIERLGLVWGGE